MRKVQYFTTNEIMEALAHDFKDILNSECCKDTDKYEVFISSDGETWHIVGKCSRFHAVRHIRIACKTWSVAREVRYIKYINLKNNCQKILEV